MLNNIAKYRQTKNGSLIFGVVSLGLFYGFASLAIDSGNLLHYAVALALLILGFKDIGTYVRITSKKYVTKPSSNRKSRKKA